VIRNLTRIAVIGGSGLESLLQGTRQIRVGTAYGPAPLISVGTIGKEEVAFLPRHGPKHDLPPHKVNYRANLSALKQLGVERIIATNAVGAINSKYNPGDLSIPADIIDMTRARAATFYDSSPVTHIDVSQPYCPEVRRIMIDSSIGGKAKVWDDSVLVATEGPRYETPAEIRMLETLGGDLVGMTGAPETFLARELEICYSTLCFVSNRAAGKQDKLSAVEVMEIGKRTMPEITNLIRKTVEKIPTKRTCVCSGATRDAQV
jgi:5'-methylthioadenosine phosphorylase